VLNSRAAKLGPLSMSDLGLGYFGGTLLVLAALGSQTPEAGEATIAGLRILSILTLPYTLFSLGYQSFVLRFWCPLCVLVQLALWGQALALWRMPFVPALEHFWAAGPALLLLPLPLAAWLSAKAAVARGIEHDPLLLKYNRVVRDPRFLEGVLRDLPREDLLIAPLELRCGHVDAPVQVTLYADVLCNHCLEMHRDLSDVQARNPQSMSLRTFLVGDDRGEVIARRLLLHVAASVHEGNNEEAHDKFLRWNRDVENRMTSALRYPERGTPPVEALCEEHSRWTRSCGIKTTPIVFVDDKRWPLEYPSPCIEALVRARADNAGADGTALSAVP
jgi:hypothetical protein